ncbi:hypothetical protein MPTK1_6g11180 [Marchantia polymorpha subsp. ruderalis]|uniref:Uncharacterized protein n=2 Tax=Marchantia polymorpha TaxID=3197 RepID=A0AAF6BQU6_MARPO|nr:hypothetical protein MARPO_0016s0158 [Marchantia polymorpha]BBN14380.1 hypothetical protein Mp_6g11180 [Marchantia polymorpha subsp. ruderalis]|eukprot:PTQ45114.1 hypothetical protein MARPO_0016s0158 [Marchantia polymorpha]
MSLAASLVHDQRTNESAHRVVSMKQTKYEIGMKSMCKCQENTLARSSKKVHSQEEGWIGRSMVTFRIVQTSGHRRSSLGSSHLGIFVAAVCWADGFALTPRE